MVSRVQKELPTLFALAHDHSETGRMQLALKLADLFLNQETKLEVREEKLVNDLIDELLKNNSPSIRHALAEKFADAARMPRKMALSLAHDSIEVAKAVLLANEALTDEDLLAVIETESTDHASAIASRREISEAIADALVTTGDLDVMKLVAENLGAHLSSRAMSVLGEAARLTSTLQKPVVLRPELSESMATKLYWWLAEDLRRVALERFGFTSNLLNIALSETIESKLQVHLLERDDAQAMKTVADWLEAREAIKVEILPEVLRLRHFRLFNILLSRLSGLPEKMVVTIVQEQGGRLFAALARAIGITKGSFVSLFLLSRGARDGEQIVHPQELSFALTAFDRLDQALAQEMLTTWKSHPEYLEDRPEDDWALQA